MVGFLQGNASPLTEYEPPADELNAAGYGFHMLHPEAGGQIRSTR